MSIAVFSTAVVGIAFCLGCAVGYRVAIRRVEAEMDRMLAEREES